jgi:hypothetical protein
MPAPPRSPATEKIHRDHPVPGFQVSVDDGRRRCNAGVQVGHVDGAEALQSRPHHVLVGLGLRDLDARRQRLAPRRLDLLGNALGPFGVEIRHDELRSSSRQRQRARAADPRCATRHQRDLAFELVHDRPSLGVARE